MRISRGSFLLDQRIERRSDPHAVRTVRINVRINAHVTMLLLFALTSTLICALHLSVLINVRFCAQLDLHSNECVRKQVPVMRIEQHVSPNALFGVHLNMLFSNTLDCTFILMCTSTGKSSGNLFQCASQCADQRVVESRVERRTVK